MLIDVKYSLHKLRNIWIKNIEIFGKYASMIL